MVSIRKMTINDAKTTFEYSNNLENTYYMLNNPFESLKETEEFLIKCITEYDKESPRYLAVAVVYENKHIGEVFASLNKNEADIGWLLHRDYWGKGIASAAAKLFTEYLINNYSVNHFIAFCDERNIASQRIMEKLGMKFTGYNGIRNYSKAVSPAREMKYEMTV